MKEQKIRRGLLCLIAAVGIQTLTVLYGLYVNYCNLELATRNAAELGATKFDIPITSIFGPSLSGIALLIVFSYFVLQDFKRGKAWAWIGALCVLLVTAPSFALPASIIGMISLLDEEVRGEFLAKLNFNA